MTAEKKTIGGATVTRSRRKAGVGSKALDAPTVEGILTEEYGPFPTGPRLDPISEVVSCILSQHTSDVNSERAFKQLMETFGSFEEIARADLELIAASINVGGLARIKAPRIKQVLNLIMEKRGALDLDFLQDMSMEDAKAWLKELPGIGPKTAAIILCFALGMPAMAVDTHVFRVSKRLGLVGAKTSYERAHDILEGAVEPEQVYPLHMGLITHGRKVCKAPRPLCGQCLLAWGCPSSQVGLDGKTPRKRAAPPS